MSAISVFILVFVFTFVTYGGKSLVIYCYITWKYRYIFPSGDMGLTGILLLIFVAFWTARVDQFNFQIGNISYSFFENIGAFVLWTGCVDGFHRDPFLSLKIKKNCDLFVGKVFSTGIACWDITFSVSLCSRLLSNFSFFLLQRYQLKNRILTSSSFSTFFQ